MVGGLQPGGSHLCSISCDEEQEKEGNKVGIHQYDLLCHPIDEKGGRIKSSCPSV